MPFALAYRLLYLPFEASNIQRMAGHRDESTGGGINMKVHYLIFTAVLLAPAPLIAADGTAKKGDTDRSRYSDRDQRKSYDDEEEKLEQALKAGQDKNFYRRELEKMGYQITSVNYDKPDYAEYEIVKGSNSFEAQIDFDKNGKATKVDIAPNLWRTDSTKAALRGKKVSAPKGAIANPERYSDRDRRKAYDSEEEKLEKTLKTGETKQTYRSQLEKMGYKVTSVNADKPDYVEYEIVKGNDTYEVQIDFDKNSGKATKVDVTSNLWQAEATDKALSQKQEKAAKR
jgi:uncharacterized protein YmfQ (DUF2313 family)